MGNIYTVVPMNDEVRDWLTKEGVAAPPVDGRWSTMRELRDVLSRYDVEYREDKRDGGWDAEIHDRVRGWRATIWTKKAPSEDVPFEHSYHKPDERLMMAILVELAKFCGPFMVMDGSSVIPVVVDANGDPERLANAMHGH
jgi:hypothetical protein